MVAAAAISESATVRRRLTEYLDNLRFLGVDLDGLELQSLGILEGPELGKMLDQLKNAKLDGAVTSKEGSASNGPGTYWTAALMPGTLARR